MVVADDYVTVHMVFKGHFTGSFGHSEGQGQVIDFNATDLLKVKDGRITAGVAPGAELLDGMFYRPVTTFGQTG